MDDERKKLQIAKESKLMVVVFTAIVSAFDTSNKTDNAATCAAIAFNIAAAGKNKQVISFRCPPFERG